MESIEKLREKRDGFVEKRDKLNVKIKGLNAKIAQLETQEVMNTLTELNLSPAEARDLLRRAKSAILNAGTIEGGGE